MKKKKILTENEILEFDKRFQEREEFLKKIKKLLKEKGYDKSK